MHKFSLAALFFGFVIYVQAQNAPWTEDRLQAVDHLGQSFIVPEEAPVVNLDDVWMNWETVHNFAFGKNRGDMPMITDLNALHPYFRDKITELIAICKSKGIELAVVETYRTVAKQNEYKGLGKIYTRTGGGRSKHQYGLAVDVVPIINSEAQWEDEALWKRVGVVGEKLGLRWGGRWRHPFDPGHFEWGGGVSGASMELGRTPIIPNPENYPSLNDDLVKLHVYWGHWEDEQKSSLVARAKQSE